MIRVNKPQQAPRALQDKGPAARAAICAACSGARASIQRGETALDFAPAVYAHRTVKKALEAAHREKCCFCESKVKHVAPGDVEHYRPKAAVQQARKAPIEYPGYYWLAYDPGLRAQARAWLARSVADEAEYAAMTRAALRSPSP